MLQHSNYKITIETFVDFKNKILRKRFNIFDTSYNSNSKNRYTLNFVDIKTNNLLIIVKNRNHRSEMKKLFERGKLYFQKREEEAARKREEKANGEISKKALKEIKVENNMQLISNSISGGENKLSS